MLNKNLLSLGFRYAYVDLFSLDTASFSEVLRLFFGSSRRRPLRDASWDFGTGSVQTTGTVRTSSKTSHGHADQDRYGGNDNSAPPGSEALPSLLSKAELDYQIDAGLRDANMDLNGLRRNSFGLQKGLEAEPYSPRDHVSSLRAMPNCDIVGFNDGVLLR